MKHLLFLLWIASFPAIGAEKPDIVMIAIDDLRPMLGCYGDTRIKTPSIDKLAARGVVFERAYCQYAKCGTSRLSLMTGLRPDSVNVFSNNEKEVIAFRKSHPEAVSMAKWLKDEGGYHTQSWGKIYHDGWDSASDWSAPSSPGRESEMLEIVDENNPQDATVIADRWNCPVMQSPDVPDEHLFAGRMTNAVIDVLKNRDSIKKPIFLAVGYRRPHLPFVAPKRYFDQYKPDKTWLAKNPAPNPGSPVMAWFNSDGYVGGARKIGLTMPSSPDREEAIAWNGFEMRSYVGVPPHGEIPVETQLNLHHAYAACVSYVDAQIGRLLEHVTDDTVVILWSDHGWHLGEQSTWGKMTNFEIATRIPLIVAHPDFKPGRTKSLSELVDLYPTLCAFAHVKPPTHLQGNSLVAIVENPEAPTTDLAFSQYTRFKDRYMGYAMRTDRFRLVVWKDQKTGKVVERELYDHDTDPDELKNVAGSNPDLIEQLETQLWKEWR